MFGLGHGHSLSLAASRPLSVPFVGALDGFTSGLVVCWSVTQRLLSSYTGPLLLVRADRTGQPTLAIGYNADGTWDTAALMTFAGSDSVYVVTAYAQYGAYDFTEPSAASQPRIVNAGVLEANGAFFNGGQDLANVVVAFPSGSTRQVVTRLNVPTGGGGGMWEHLGSASDTGVYVNSFGGVYSDMPETDARVFSASLTNDVDHVLSEERNGVSASTRVDGSVVASRSDATGAMAVGPAYCAVGQRHGYKIIGNIQTHCQWSDTNNATGRAAALL